jgi:hypothetical protein
MEANMNRSFSRQGRDIARPCMVPSGDHQMESGTYVQSGAAKPGQLTDGGVGSSPGPKTSYTRRLYAGSATGLSVCGQGMQPRKSAYARFAPRESWISLDNNFRKGALLPGYN